MKKFFNNSVNNTAAMAGGFDQEACSKAWKSSSLKKKAIMLFTLGTFFAQGMFAQSDAADEIKDLWDDQINPILNAVLGIAVGIAAIVVGIQFFQGKKEALKQLGHVIAGAVVVKVLSNIIAGILSGSKNEINV